MRGYGTRVASVQDAPPPDDDDDDIFGVDKKRREEEALAERRSRIANSALSHKPFTDTTTFPATEPTNTAKRAARSDAESERREKICRTHPSTGNHVTPSTMKSEATYEMNRKRTKAPDSAVFDMFAPGKVAPVAGCSGPNTGVDAPVEAGGYARLRPGDTLRDGRYVVGAELGRGVFASVVRATERTTGRKVAIKLSRANAAMRRAALRELATLRHVHGTPTASGGKDTNAPSVVRVVDDFVHREAHVAIVFELLGCTLRDVLSQHPGGVRMAAVRHYGVQLLRALAHLTRADVVHADVKPDNVLLSADRATLSLADFGCALRAEHRGVDGAPVNVYLAARFYRAPETILGLSPTPAVDTWAAACVLYELYTGSVCFSAKSNNAQLRAIVDACGSIPARMWRRAPARDVHLDADGRMLCREVDAATGVESVTTLPRRAKIQSSAVRDAIMRASAGDDQGINAPVFADLIESMLTVDPTKRISPTDALRHSFFKPPQSSEAKSAS